MTKKLAYGLVKDNVYLSIARSFIRNGINVENAQEVVPLCSFLQARYGLVDSEDEKDFCEGVLRAVAFIAHEAPSINLAQYALLKYEDFMGKLFNDGQLKDELEALGVNPTA